MAAAMAGGSRFLFDAYFKSLLSLTVLCKQSQDIEATAQIQPLPQPSLPPAAPIPAPQGTPSVEELIQQSQWNLQQQEQHLLAMRQEQVTSAVALAIEQQMQKVLEETQLDMNEFDNLLQPIIDTCTKDAISAGKNWMFSNAKSPAHCELMAGHLRNRITAEGAHFELRLHLIYLINDVLHHCQRKQARDLLAALQKVVVPIYCTSFLAVEEDKQQKIARLLQLWEKNGYFDESIIQQLQSPALGLGQYQANLITEYATVVQPVQVAFQQQIQNLKTQHEEFVNSLTQQQQQQQIQIPPLENEVKSTPPPQAPTAAPTTAPPSVPVTQADDGKSQLPLAGSTEYDTTGSGVQDPASGGPRGPGSHDQIPPNKPPWFDQPHPVAPWGQQQQGPPHCPPWNNNHEGMWNEQRDQGWNNQRETPWNNQPDPSWNNQFEAPWNNQHEQPPWGGGQREPPFRMQRPPHFRGPFPPHQQHPQFNQPPHPHNFNRFPPRFMQDDFPPRHPFERPPYPHRFDYPQGDFPQGKLEDHEYKPLDPKDIRLPPPMPPSERLLAAVEAFYSPPSHDRPRNSEGWEQNGLYEFFRAKMRARRRKGQEKRNSGPSRSRSRSKSRGRSSSRSNSRSSKSSGSYSRSRSRSCSRSRSYSRSQSRSRSRSRSSHSRSRSRSRSRSKSYSPGRRRRSRSRSPTPPSSAGLGSSSGPPIPESRLGEENKGHQMLVKMGWSGSGGLGAKEQGIQDPIKGGDIRDKWDQYKGVGVALDDPYENYRRNKSYSFIARMKARDEC
nr:PREDICTED: calcium homeostasis endoplasmic reticulum protein [Apteryx mantelli mantelli]